MNKIYQKNTPNFKNPVKRKIDGFTLIELLVVVLILGILTAIALPQYQTAVDHARFSQLIVNTGSLLKAEQMHLMSRGKYAISWEALASFIPEGYTISSSSSRTLVNQGYSIQISIGCSTPADENGSQPADCPAGYLFSRDNRVHVAYWTDMSGKDRRCLAYAEGGNRAKTLCRTITASETEYPLSNGGVYFKF